MGSTTKTQTSSRAKSADAPPRAIRASRRVTKAAPAAPFTSPVNAVTPGGKLGVIVGLMRRPEGATIAQMSEATDWLPHSVRGALAGSLKKKHKLAVSSEKTEAGRVYRIGSEATAAPAAG